MYHPDKQYTYKSFQFFDIGKAFEYLGIYMGSIDDDECSNNFKEYE